MKLITSLFDDLEMSGEVFFFSKQKGTSSYVPFCPKDVNFTVTWGSKKKIERLKLNIFFSYERKLTLTSN